MSAGIGSFLLQEEFGQNTVFPLWKAVASRPPTIRCVPVVIMKTPRIGIISKKEASRKILLLRRKGVHQSSRCSNRRRRWVAFVVWWSGISGMTFSGRAALLFLVRVYGFSWSCCCWRWCFGNGDWWWHWFFWARWALLDLWPCHRPLVSEIPLDPTIG